ncbi:glycine zipper 2TM domain-containing protein [Hymenobacter sp. BRD128]|uniref:YMGG-like glycine zipper-containing protein n=1 Tax=Hymenobacter sp. BRD128 TaxID=2675878 RepID=UPI00156602F9|nr:YMGG-like glycine zipper-containing protein [Hymenobacter sp. BRD128]QKG58754.1 glycine zipper 2TM domain-containing protein [Hymenobacter sp. BRD128]
MKNIRIFLSFFLLVAVLTSSHTAQAQRRFSPQAKGAVIGGGSGAILGAVINKRNRAVGGLIGGVVGAGAGYAVGKHIDNRQKKRAAAIAAMERESAYREAANRRAYLASHSATAATRETAVRSYAPAAAAVAVPAATALAASSVIPGYPAMATASAYLPNQAPADPSNPYAGTAYRQRSW